jgi:hypothetical protein
VLFSKKLMLEEQFLLKRSEYPNILGNTCDLLSVSPVLGLQAWTTRPCFFCTFLHSSVSILFALKDGAGTHRSVTLSCLKLLPRRLLPVAPAGGHVITWLRNGFHSITYLRLAGLALGVFLKGVFEIN